MIRGFDTGTLPPALLSGGCEVKVSLARWWWLVVLVLAGGCASTQLNYNTADLASSLASLTKRQIFFNLSQAMDDPDFVPSQVTISIGTAQTLNSVTPSLTLPLGPTLTTATRVTDAGRNAGNQFTQQFVTPSPGLGLQFVDAWNQTWTMVPANSANQLRRLRVLYQFVTGTLTRRSGAAPLTLEEAEKLFICEYPIQALAVPSSPPGDNVAYVLDGCPDNTGTRRARVHYADPTFTQGPNCVLCVDDLKSKHPRLEVNPNLKYAFIHAGSQRTDDMERIGGYGTTDFYVCAKQGGNCRLAPNQEPFDGRRAFSDFVLFVVEAMSQPAPGSGTGRSTGGAAFVYSVR
ncbi:hypothetical protein [Reyranella sp.]|uniref:hypothetical protein n=1 Tax=Reyranella sp. TaxID=1929291 RepID=UPI003BAA3F87